MHSSSKKVSFDEKLQINILRTWDYAYRDARKSNWMQLGRDRARFQRRIHQCEEILSPILEKKIAIITNSCVS
jgi:hypothetical protein